MKVIIVRDTEFNTTLVFSSDEKLLEYVKTFYPRAKNLRIKRNSRGGNLTVYNHNAQCFRGWRWTLEEIEVDEEIRKHNERMEGVR